MNPLSATLVFTKIPGKAPVKTRLQETSGLSQQETELLALAFLADTLAMLQPLDHRIFLASDPETNVDELRQKLALLPPGGAPCALEKLTLLPQEGSTFGEKLRNAISAVANDAPEGLLILGSDAPTVPVPLIGHAGNLVQKKRAVLGPCFDGGVYLIGLPAAVLASPDWIDACFGSPSVTELSALALACHKRNVPLALLPHHTDIDVLDDLAHVFFARELSFTDALFTIPRHTLAVLDSLGITLHRTTDNNRRFELHRS